MSKADGLSGTLPLTYYALPKRISIIASTVTNTVEGRGPNYSPNVARSHTHISGAMSMKRMNDFVVKGKESPPAGVNCHTLGWTRVTPAGKPAFIFLPILVQDGKSASRTFNEISREEAKQFLQSSTIRSYARCFERYAHTDIISAHF